MLLDMRLILATTAVLLYTGCSSEHAVCEEDPLADSCLEDEALGVFVSPQGSDIQGDGTRQYPYATIQRALTLVADVGGPRRRVYLCGSEYPESVGLDSRHAGLSLVGGLDCNWRPNGKRVVFGGGASVPLGIFASGSTILISGVELHGTASPDGNSIAVVTEANTIFRNVHLVAERGGDGASGVAITTSDPYPKCHNPPGWNMPYEGGVNCCLTEWSVGGAGADLLERNGRPGTIANRGLDDTACDAGGSGGVGQRGADGAAATSGATTLGSPFVRDSGVGPSGSPGGTGQGGGGGGRNVMANGGGGSAGGCGGLATGGRPGGGSIAIFARGGHVSVFDSVLEVGDGGAGGGGVPSAAGEGSQGPGGSPYPPTSGACPGGVGGSGGTGGASGGGAGGVSVGVAYDLSLSTPESVLDAPTMHSLVLGQPGSGGAGGLPELRGVDGEAAATLAL